jgi:DNA-binding SARP family transcriptional activator
MSPESARGVTPTERPPLELRVFGSVDLSGRDGLEAILVQPKRVALFTYLVLARPRGFHRRDRLVALFWPEHSADSARASLRKALYAIRQSVGEGALVSRGDEELAVNRDALWCDALEFDAAVARNDLTTAYELYRAELLEAFFADAPGFERWLEAERQRYREAAATAAWTLAERHESSHELTLAARWARRVAALAPSDERALRRVLMLLDRAGDRAGAVRVYEEFAARLRADYQVDPSAETIALVRRLRVS